MTKFWKPVEQELSAPAIMRSMESSLDDFDRLCEFNSQFFNMNKNSVLKPCAKCNSPNGKSFLLYNEEEKLQVSSVEDFLQKLGCIRDSTKVKVVSIFGNTSDGISHTLNHVFFKGDHVFRISNNEHCCTLGVWAAYDPVLNIICLDTEGMQGMSCVLYDTIATNISFSL